MKIKFLITLIIAFNSASCNAQNSWDWKGCKKSFVREFTSIGDEDDYFWKTLDNRIQSIRFIEGKVFDVNVESSNLSYRNITESIIRNRKVISYSIVDEALGVNTGVLYTINFTDGILTLDGFFKDELYEFINRCPN